MGGLQRDYRHKQADRLACEQHQNKNKHIKLTARVIDYISEKLKIYWSPQQVVGRLNLDKNIKISTKPIKTHRLQMMRL